MDFHRLKTPEGGELHREGMCMCTGGGAHTHTHTHTHTHMHAGNRVRTEVPGQDTLEDRGTRGSAPFQTGGFLQQGGVACPTHIRLEATVCWGANSLLLQDRNQGGALPQSYPGRPLTLDGEICVNGGKLCTWGCLGPAVGGGRGGNQPLAEPGLEASWAPGRGAG